MSEFFCRIFSVFDEPKDFFIFTAVIAAVISACATLLINRKILKQQSHLRAEEVRLAELKEKRKAHGRAYELAVLLEGGSSLTAMDIGYLKEDRVRAINASFEEAYPLIAELKRISGIDIAAIKTGVAKIHEAASGFRNTFQNTLLNLDNKDQDSAGDLRQEAFDYSLMMLAQDKEVLSMLDQEVEKIDVLILDVQERIKLL